MKLFVPIHSLFLSASLLMPLSVVACSQGNSSPDDDDGGGGGAQTSSGGSTSSGGDTQGSGGNSPTSGGTGGGHFQDDGECWFLFPEERGARVTVTSYEAEDMESNGEILGPTREFGQVAAEASGRKAVRLDAEGESVSFENQRNSNAIVIRYSIPDNGADYWTKLTVLVNGEERAKLDVTSRYSWSYRNEDDNIFNTPEQNNPAAGQAHHFFDETRALLGDIPAGATVSVMKAAGDGAAYYDIDLVELESVPAPRPKPDGFKSIVEDCGATNNGDADDDTGAFQACLDNPGAGIYIPEGVFHIKSATLQVNTTTIQGAGMWYSTIMGDFAHFTCWNRGCKYSDFSVFGDTTARNDSDHAAAFDGGANQNVVLDRIWVEHRRVGYWTNGPSDNIVIKNSRFRNLHADAVNFYGGSKNATMEHCHIRNTGDDALAAWAHDYDGRSNNEGIVFKNNYIQVPWKANCIGIYGGGDLTVSDNVCADVLQYPGILVARSFDSHAFTGMNLFERNTLLRAGGFTYGSAQGAFKIHANQGPVDNIWVKGLDIIAPTHFGIHIQGSPWDDSTYVGNTYFENVNIENPIDGAFLLTDGSKGAMDATNVVHTGSAAGVIQDGGSSFTINKNGDGNTGW